MDTEMADAVSSNDSQASAGLGHHGLEYSSLLDFKSMKEVYRGRHSVVWRCLCKRSKLPAVVKGYVKEKMRVRHFQQVAREVSLMQKCRVAGVVRFMGSFEDPKCIYIVQEDCSKGDLFQMLNDSGGVMPEQVVVVKVIAPLLHSLVHLHANNVLHRDIKPENIFFNEAGDLKLGDLGLAICTTSERPKSRVGTLDYMAPEVISLPNHEEREAVEKKHGMHNVSYYGAKADIWSVGILAYELLVGRPPFEVEGERETALRIMFDDNITFPPKLSLEAVAFIKLALSKSATKRPAAADLLHHVWMAAFGVRPPRPLAAPAAPRMDATPAAVVAHGGGASGPSAIGRAGTMPANRLAAISSAGHSSSSSMDAPGLAAAGGHQQPGQMPASPASPEKTGVRASASNRFKSFFSGKRFSRK